MAMCQATGAKGGHVVQTLGHVGLRRLLAHVLPALLLSVYPA